MAKLSERKNFSFSEEETGKLEQLARANTSGNEAMLIRTLINRAFITPQEFGLLPPRSSGDPTSSMRISGNYPSEDYAGRVYMTAAARKYRVDINLVDSPIRIEEANRPGMYRIRRTEELDALGRFEPDTVVHFVEPKALWYVTFADGEVITIRSTPNYRNFDSDFEVVEGEE